MKNKIAISPFGQRMSRSPFTSLPLSVDSTSHKLIQLVLLFTFLSLSHALIGSDVDDPVDFNNELLLQYDSKPEIDSHLEKLLQLKDSIKELIKQREQLSQTGSDDESYDKENILPVKRVFCNGFTGCGGRFRGRRVQQRALIELRKRMLRQAALKRPLCNSNGCFNSGKKKRDEEMDNGVTLDNSFSIRQEFGSGDQEQDKSKLSKVKRLFCNGYGGCRNMGKRVSLLPLLSGKDESRNEMRNPQFRTPVLELILQPGKKKRFLASSFDMKMNNFVNNLPH